MEPDAKKTPLSQPRLRAKLIYNPTSGAAVSSPVQLLDILTELQNWNIIPEVFLIQPGCDMQQMVRDALQRGIRLFIVSGGDGTIDSVAAELVGTWGTVGILPTGTRNNVALSLDIPFSIPEAVALLRTGQQIKIDTGQVRCQDIRRSFVEACSVGLLSAIFPAADEIQKGNLARIADLVAAWVASPPAQMRIELDKKHEISVQGHVVLIGNMPYMGPNFRLSHGSSYQDGLLDILLIATPSKLDLLSNVVQIVGGGPEDPRIQRYRAHHITIETDPPMPVIADGNSLGEGRLEIQAKRRSLSVITRQLPGSSTETPDPNIHTN